LEQASDGSLTIRRRSNNATDSGRTSNGTGIPTVTITLRDWASNPLAQIILNDGSRLDTAAIDRLTNHLPVVTNPGTDGNLNDQRLAGGDALRLDLNTAFTDPDGDALSYRLQRSDGRDLPDWISLDASSGTLNATPNFYAQGGYQFTVTATDSRAGATQAQFSLRVDNVIQPVAPIASLPLLDRRAVAGLAFQYQPHPNSFIDPDAPATVPGDAAGSNNTLSYSARLSDGSPLPDWLRFDPTSQRFSGTPGDGDLGQLDIQLTATDGLSSNQRYTLDIQPPGPVALTEIGHDQPRRAIDLGDERAGLRIRGIGRDLQAHRNPRLRQWCRVQRRRGQRQPAPATQAA